MPVVLTLGGNIKVRIYFRDHNPPHVHVTAPGAEAVFELDTLDCVSSYGFTKATLGRIKQALIARHDYLKEQWDEYKS